MKTLTSTLLAYQKKNNLFPLAKLHMSIAGVTIDLTKTRIKKIKTQETNWSQKVWLTCDNSDKFFKDAYIAKRHWDDSTNYDAWVYLQEGGYIYQNIGGKGDSGLVEPTWPTTIGETVVDNEIEWECVNVDMILPGNGATLYLGLLTSAGEEYQKLHSYRIINESFITYQGKALVEIYMEGKPDNINHCLAADTFTPDEDNPCTVQEHLNMVLNAGFTDLWQAEYSYKYLDHARSNPPNGYLYQNTAGDGTSGSSEPVWPTTIGDTVVDGDLTWECIWDTDPYAEGDVAPQLDYVGTDSLIDAYRPGAGFDIQFGTSQLSAARRLLDMTECVIKFGENYEDIVIDTVTNSGTTYDYEYSLSLADHKFYYKNITKGLPIPNVVTVKSLLGESPFYSGTFDDESYYKYYLTLKSTLSSDSRGAKIAEAVVKKAEAEAMSGLIQVPINIGSEIFDYVHITDSRDGTEFTGNINSITNVIDFEKKQWNQYIGFGLWYPLINLIKNMSDNNQSSIDTLYNIINSVTENQVELANKIDK